MKKLLILSFLLLIAALTLTGCTSPGAADPEPTQEQATATPEPVPRYIPPTPEPLVTPRTMEGVIEEPSPGATLILIDPADKPTKPPIIFEPYVEVTEAALGLTFQVPSYWERAGDNPNAPTAVVYQEPLSAVRSGTGVQSTVTIQMVLGTGTQSTKDAEAYIDTILKNLAENEAYKNLEASSTADNRVKGLGETGRYVTYRVDYFPRGEAGASIRMRGRLLVVPVDRKLYMIRYICPAEFNVGPLDPKKGDTGGYEDVYKKIRETIKEI